MSHEATGYFALIVLLLMAGGAIAYLVWSIRRSRFTVAQYFYYLYGRVMTRILYRAQIQGTIDLPPDRGAVIVCNHRSPFDPAFIQLATDRVVHWMVAREYCSHPLYSWFFTIPQAIPVRRGGIDTAATKIAIRYAKRGDMVGMFPEGRLNDTPELLLPGRPGAVLVALKAEVPIIPCYITGSPRGKTLIGSMFVPAQGKLVIGKPIDISAYYGREKDREVLEEATRKILYEIALLAGEKDFKPELAGRRWLPEE
jgi:1-acyl-sn-glycerol-3-phosphate acyltransferase